jgi:hypothetical protein
MRAAPPGFSVVVGAGVDAGARRRVGANGWAY